MRARNGWREVLGALGVYFVWQYLVWVTGRQPAGPAMLHGRAVWHLEGVLGLDVEPWLQRAAASVPGLVTWANLYYALAHVAIVGGMLLATWWRGSMDAYRDTRGLLLGVTGLSFLLQLWQCAPLRLLGVGVRDTALSQGVSVYQATEGHVDIYSALPSLHVGWALAVAWVVYRHGRGPWRWLMLHGPLTVLAVIVTGNHSVVDCVAAAAVVGVVGGVLFGRLGHDRRHLRATGQGQDLRGGAPVAERGRLGAAMLLGDANQSSQRGNDHGVRTGGPLVATWARAAR